MSNFNSGYELSEKKKRYTSSTCEGNYFSDFFKVMLHYVEKLSYNNAIISNFQSKTIYSCNLTQYVKNLH